MDLQVASTGKTFYEVPDSVAALLREAFPESFKPAPRRAAPVCQAASANLNGPKEPVWDVFEFPLSGEVAIRCTCQRQTLFYRGAAEQAGQFKWFIGGEGRLAPEHVVWEYATRKGVDPEIAVERNRRATMDKESACAKQNRLVGPVPLQKQPGEPE